MRLKRSSLRACPRCQSVKYLDWKVDWGGARFVDKYLIECVGCGVRGNYEYSPKEAIDVWNEFAARAKQEPK